MGVIVCPGVHDRDLTQQFIQGLSRSRDTALYPESWWVFPADRYPAYSGWHLLRFLHEHCSRDGPDLAFSTPLVFIGFSAGVVGAASAAVAWQQLGGSVKALMAIDGWGVPLLGGFPTHRLSHDLFTHWSSALLGAGQDSFYADPEVGHLDVWRSPHTAHGYWVTADTAKAPLPTTAANFLTALLRRYGERF